VSRQWIWSASARSAASWWTRLADRC
jgi:hypothetical protein